MRYLLVMIAALSITVAVQAQERGWVLIEQPDAEYAQAWVEALCDNAILDAVERGELPRDRFGRGAAHGGGLSPGLYSIAVFRDSDGRRWGGVSGRYATPWLADLLQSYTTSLAEVRYVTTLDGYEREVPDADADVP